jgi:hypothetical protein
MCCLNMTPSLHPGRSNALIGDALGWNVVIGSYGAYVLSPPAAIPPSLFCLGFRIVISHDLGAFTLDVLSHQETRMHLQQFIGMLRRTVEQLYGVVMAISTHHPPQSVIY